MLLFSLFRRISNIADMTSFSANPIQAIAGERSLLQQNKLKAYLLEPKHIRACEYQTVKNLSRRIAYEMNEWQQEQKLNSGDKTYLITFLK